jgi:hypothetical protein
LLIIICVGLPITGVFSFIILFISGLVIVNGQVNRSLKRFITIFVIAISIFLVNGLLPRAAIEEGHNIFFTKGSNETLEREMPPKAYNFMKEQFLKRYPLDKRRDFTGAKGWTSPVPKSLFAFSADSAFSKPKYSRIVDSINFENLTEFRGGFVNSLDYNWFGSSDIKRESMPFFVMYELSPSSVNSSLCWTGYLLWEKADGHYQTIYHQQRECRKIIKSDIGKKVFGVSINNKDQLSFWGRFNAIRLKIRYFFSSKKQMHLTQDNNKEAYLSMHLSLSPLLIFSLALKRILEILGVFFILGLMIKINHKRFITAALIIGIAAVMVYLYCPQFFGQYYINEGGEDGLTHATYGREILVNLISGNWMQALRGGQDIFWDTPGFRYFRALEKLFFGDTNFGYLAVILIFPYILFGFLANFISKKWVFWSTIAFLLAILVHSHEIEGLGFTYHIYVMVARGGWPDTLAYAAFPGAFTLLLRYVKARNGAYYWYGFLAHFLLFVTVFMRPQFVISTLVIVAYFAARLILERRFNEVIFSWLGFMPIFFPLWHNYFFGHKLYPFTGSVHLAVNIPPSVYLNAFRELLASNFSGQDLTKVMSHIKDTIGPRYRLVFLGAVFYMAFLKRRIPFEMRMVAVVCLSLHFVNLFIFATYFRYVFLTWGLTVVVTIFLVWSWLNAKEGIKFLRRNQTYGTKLI